MSEIESWIAQAHLANKRADKLYERNANLVAAFMLKLREENECNGPCADNEKCGCWGEMQNYIMLAKSAEKP